MDCNRPGGTVGYHFGPSASERQKVGRIRDGPGGNPGFHAKEIRTTPDLETDRLSSRGTVDTEAENADGHERPCAHEHCTLLWQNLN